MKSRKAGESRSHAKKSSSGAVKPIAMPMGGAPGRPRKAPLAPSDTTSANQMARTRRTLKRIPLDAAESDGGGRTVVDMAMFQ